MSERPALQLYVKDWLTNQKLRRCSPAARGVWLDVICTLHDSEGGGDYGIARYSLKELSRAVHAPLRCLQELVEKGVLKGCDAGVTHPGLIYIPRSGRKDGDPVTLIEPTQGPIWFSSRMVKDEHRRRTAGASTRFGARPVDDDDAPAPAIRSTKKQAPSGWDGDAPIRRPGGDVETSPSQRDGERKPSPSQWPDERQGDGSPSPSPSPSPIPSTTTVAVGGSTHAAVPRAGGGESPPVSGFQTPAGEVCVALRREFGINADPLNRDLAALLDAGATVEEFRSVAAALLDGRPLANPFAYVLRVVSNRRLQAAALSRQLRGTSAPPLPQSKQGRALPPLDETVQEAARLLGHRPDNSTEIIDA